MAKNILYVQTSGPDSPDRLYPPFVLASTARAMGVEATIYFMGKGILAVRKGEPAKIKQGDFPTLKEAMDKAAAEGVRMLVCAQSARLWGVSAEAGEFEEPVEVVGAATLNDLALEADAVLTF